MYYGNTVSGYAPNYWGKVTHSTMWRLVNFCYPDTIFQKLINGPEQKRKEKLIYKKVVVLSVRNIDETSLSETVISKLSRVLVTEGSPTSCINIVILSGRRLPYCHLQV